MSNPSKRKGSQFEVLIRDYLKDVWSRDIERLTLSGGQDRGDIANFRFGREGQHLLAVECKNRTQLSLPAWVSEAQVEAKNYEAIAGIVIHKRKGKGQAADQFVTLTLADFLTILRAAAS